MWLLEHSFEDSFNFLHVCMSVVNIANTCSNMLMQLAHIMRLTYVNGLELSKSKCN